MPGAPDRGGPGGSSGRGKSGGRGKAKGITGTGPFEYPIWERFILRETEPPVRHQMPAPKRFVPVHGQPITGILPTFLHVQRQFTTPDRTGGRIGSTAGEGADTDCASVEAESGGYPGAGGGTRASPYGAGAAGTGTAGVRKYAICRCCQALIRVMPIRLRRRANRPHVTNLRHRLTELQEACPTSTSELRGKRCDWDGSAEVIRMSYTSVSCKGCWCY